MATTGRLRLGLKLLGFLLLSSTFGCSHERYNCQEGLAQRILPPLNIDIQEELPLPKTTAQEAAHGSQARLGQPKLFDEPNPASVKLWPPAQGNEGSCDLTVAEAIGTAFRQQPRLRVYLESVEQARRGQD